MGLLSRQAAVQRGPATLVVWCAVAVSSESKHCLLEVGVRLLRLGNLQSFKSLFQDYINRKQLLSHGGLSAGRTGLSRGAALVRPQPGEACLFGDGICL